MEYTVENPDPNRDIIGQDGLILPKEIADLAKSLYDHSYSAAKDRHIKLVNMFNWGTGDKLARGVGWSFIHHGDIEHIMTTTMKI